MYVHTLCYYMYVHVCTYSVLLHVCTCMYILCVTDTGLVVGYALSLDNDNTFMVETVHHYYKSV